MAERFELVEKAILKMVEDKKYSTLRDILLTMNPADIAQVFSGLAQRQVPLLFRLLPTEAATECFAEMESEEQELLILGFSDNELKLLLDELYADDAADLVEEMPRALPFPPAPALPPVCRSRALQSWPTAGCGAISATIPAGSTSASPPTAAAPGASLFPPSSQPPPRPFP